MSDIYRMLSPEERGEYDALLHEAGYDERGDRRRQSETKERMHSLLLDAEQAGKAWARYVIDDDALEGHLKRFKKWDRTRQVLQTRAGEVVVKRSAVMSLRRRDEETGRQYWQDTFYPDMTRADLMDVIKGASSRIASDRVNIATARRLIALLDATGADLVSDALEKADKSLDDYLTEEAV